MMNNTSFRFKEHPGDFFRNQEVIKLPNPLEDLESFLVQFLKNYQSDERVNHLNDLYKLLYNEFLNQEDKIKFMQLSDCRTYLEIENKIQRLTSELKNEAFENFYNLVQTKQIELIENGEN